MPAAPVASTICAPSMAAPRSALVGGFDRPDLDAEARLDGIAGRLHDVALAAGDRHRRAFAREQHRRALADRARAAEHHGALARERAAVRQPRHGGGGRGVGAVAVEHHRDAELGEEFLRTAASSASPSAMLPPPMKIAVFFLSLGPRVKIAPSTRPPTFAALTAAVGARCDRRRRHSPRHCRRPRAGRPYRTGTAVFSCDRHARVARVGSSHEVLRLARRPVLDIVDQLVGEELHGAVRGPGDMRRQDEIRAPHVEQRMSVPRAARRSARRSRRPRSVPHRAPESAPPRRPGRRGRC